VLCFSLTSLLLGGAICGFTAVSSARSRGYPGHRQRSKKGNRKASPYGGRYLPKGTPYAAEVRAVIDGQFEMDETYKGDTFQPDCPTGGPFGPHIVNGETTKATIHWKLAFNQVTVPVATENELGKAFKKLGVKSQPTSNGVDRGSTGHIHIQGYHPPETDAALSCGKYNYSGDAKPVLIGKPRFFELPDKNANTSTFFFGTPTVIDFTPSTYTDTPDDRPFIEDFSALTGHIPNPDEAGGGPMAISFDSVPALFDIQQLKKLRSSGSVRIPTRHRSGHLHYCEDHIDNNPNDDGNTFTCKSNFDITYKITLKKHFLYRSKHAYRRK
jgi:hypothetical protein